MRDIIIQTCNHCILDSRISGIYFNEDGICNYCQDYAILSKKELHPYEYRNIVLAETINKIKKDGAGKKFDCIIGLSGGVDSSYVAYLTQKLGLRPLAIHLDNGWNSEISVRNIKNIVDILGIELFTYVIDWEEFKDLQIAFLKAGVVDIELLTDHAISAVMYKVAKKENINYFISGYNIVTEAIMPHNWSYAKWDSKNILAIHSRFGNHKIVTYPTFGLMTKVLGELKYKTVNILNLVDYDKAKVIDTLMHELNWQSYGGKHHESIFTKFYQSYILPKKFGVDKRMAHLSNLICSGQITREEALIEIGKPIYNSVEELQSELEYVVKKLGLSIDQFEKLMAEPPVSHLAYPNSQNINNILKSIKKLIKREK